jgi:hypothetical protein
MHYKILVFKNLQFEYFKQGKVKIGSTVLLKIARKIYWNFKRLIC